MVAGWGCQSQISQITPPQAQRRHIPPAILMELARTLAGAVRPGAFAFEILWHMRVASRCAYRGAA
eukprot:4054701-Prymnesium_polylepis.1